MKNLLFSLLFFTPLYTLAASCCGGGFSLPALIMGDDIAQMSSSLSYSTVTDDVLDNGKWLKRDDNNSTQVLKIDGATLITDKVQSGLSHPVSSNGMGDVSFYLGHETFPETSYSILKPKGATFLQLTLPTGKSIYDTNSKNEITGRGFYTVGMGLALMKSWKIWDAHFSAELHRSFSRRSSSGTDSSDVEVIPGWGLSQTVGLGWNKGDLRVGSAISLAHEDPIRAQGSAESTGSFQRYSTWSFSGSYMLNAEAAFSISYADQTLLGQPTNTSLSKTINFNYQHKWPR